MHSFDGFYAVKVKHNGYTYIHTYKFTIHIYILCGIAEREEEQGSMEKLQKRGKAVISNIYKICQLRQIKQYRNMYLKTDVIVNKRNLSGTAPSFVGFLSLEISGNCRVEFWCTQMM